MVKVSKSEQDTLDTAKELLKALSQKENVVCLFGDLGSGKTVFVKGIAKALGIDDYTVKSPTYTFIREYTHKKGKLIHVDLYRLEQIDDLLLDQIEEFSLVPSNLIVIEWADRMGETLPENHKDVCFEHVDEHTRKITVF
jgi:tRNA threonylcarbamoyladenosine biosynthesis protein TsaE